MNKAAVIQKQIDSCERLLEIFQEERHLYSNAGHIDMQTLLQRIEYKKQIIDTFENQKDLLSTINQESSRRNTVEVEKQLLKQLGTVLEQLLVIDQENEIMLKKLLSTVNQNAQAQSKASSTSARFNVNQPFCPNSSKQLRQAPLAPIRAQVQTQERAETSAQADTVPVKKVGRDSVNMNALRARPKTNAHHKLKAYSNLR